MDYDRIIEEKIKDIIIRELQGSASEVKVQAKEGYVTLLGFVDTLSEKSTIEEIIKKISGIKAIENCLTISTDGTLLDKEIEIEVLNKIRKHSSLDSIGVSIHKGEAVLEGEIETLREKNLAIKEASSALGVKDVISHIKINPEKDLDDVTINNRLQTEFINARLDDCDIRIDVSNGSVWMSGYVNSEYDIEIAKEIAESVEGVKKLKNLLLKREQE